MFLSLWWRWRWPLTISSSSIPTQTTVTCGLPSLFSVVTCASGPVLMKFRTDSGIVIVFLSVECNAQPHSAPTNSAALAAPNHLSETSIPLTNTGDHRQRRASRFSHLPKRQRRSIACLAPPQLINPDRAFIARVLRDDVLQ